MSQLRAFVNRLAGRPVDAADLHPGVARKSTPEEIAAGLAAELADVSDEPIGSASTSRKKRSQVLLPRRMKRRYRKSKPATWRDVETIVKKHNAARAKRVKREKASRRRNGWRRSAQA